METGSGSGRIMFLTETEEELETSSANMTGTETGLYNDEESEKRFTETVTDGIGTFLNQTGVFTNTNSSNTSHIAVTDDFQVKVSTRALKGYSVELKTKTAKVTRSFSITEKAPLRTFSWPTSPFTFKTLLRHYAKQALLTHGR